MVIDMSEEIDTTDDTEPRPDALACDGGATSHAHENRASHGGPEPSSVTALEIADGAELVIYDPGNHATWIQSNHAVQLTERV